MNANLYTLFRGMMVAAAFCGLSLFAAAPESSAQGCGCGQSHIAPSCAKPCCGGPKCSKCCKQPTETIVIHCCSKNSAAPSNGGRGINSGATQPLSTVGLQTPTYQPMMMPSMMPMVMPMAYQQPMQQFNGGRGINN
ncbi:MAG: hypothetical protein AAFP90_09015, partial [Planctomycetota bacterium]